MILLDQSMTRRKGKEERESTNETMSEPLENPVRLHNRIA